MFGHKGQFSLEHQFGLPTKSRGGKDKRGGIQKTSNFDKTSRDPRRPSVYQKAVSEYAEKKKIKEEKEKV